ncbi:hypothetical protein [Cyclonatronum proteinivorum]|uniref:hypothetical protein n=1 Tax=Cyclonatronum proteinivorum TaxID=1457365 RepID=UPI000F51B1A2|nr:hypothetical protein [Cyclonatronum proteinivorum]
MTKTFLQSPARQAAPFEQRRPCHPERSAAESKDLVVKGTQPSSSDPSTTPSLRFGYAQDDNGTCATPGAAGRAV